MIMLDFEIDIHACLNKHSYINNNMPEYEKEYLSNFIRGEMYVVSDIIITSYDEVVDFENGVTDVPAEYFDFYIKENNVFNKIDIYRSVAFNRFLFNRGEFIYRVEK